jgi:hypothetical protein
LFYKIRSNVLMSLNLGKKLATYYVKTKGRGKVVFRQMGTSFLVGSWIRRGGIIS